MGVGAGHLGKTNKIYILLEILLDAGVLSFARAALAFAFLAVPCALCRVRVFFLAVCLVYSLCVSLCAVSGVLLQRRLLVQFHFQHKVLFYYPEDRTNRTL